MSDLAVYNLERTITDFVIRDGLRDMHDVGLIPAFDMDHEKRQPVEDQKKRLLGAIASRTEADLDDWLDLTADRAPDRLARWAKLAITAHSQRGDEIALYSASVPHQLLEAYAEGIEESVADANVSQLAGKPLLKSGGRFTGQTGDMLKCSVVERFLAEGYGISFIADSFPSARPAFKYATRPLVVNPPESRHHNNRDYNFRDLLFWRDRSNQVILKHGARSPERVVDTSSADGAAELLDFVLREQPSEFASELT